MSYLLHTNVVSEWMKPQPNPGLIDWLTKTDENQTFLSVVTITELRYGLERMAQGLRRKRLDQWLAGELYPRFDGRIIPIDTSVADACGKVIAHRESLGRPIEPRDAFIAATAEVYALTLVTRNSSDFGPTLKSIVTPWT